MLREHVAAARATLSICHTGLSRGGGGHCVHTWGQLATIKHDLLVQHQDCEVGVGLASRPVSQLPPARESWSHVNPCSVPGAAALDSSLPGRLRQPLLGFLRCLCHGERTEPQAPTGQRCRCCCVTRYRKARRGFCRETVPGRQPKIFFFFFSPPP